ncbi:MAG: hypothetical protein LBK99_17760 [Opitutaceae bacterium]|jgi:hypothetical protein|nr:hypothetical protein [Opitutaceae bacterium]
MAIHQSKIYRALGGSRKLLDQFCERMEAGDSGRMLANWVEEYAHDPKALPISDQNITDFRQGYYARWQSQREASAALRDRAAASRQLLSEARAGGASIAEAAQLHATATIAEVLETFDAATLRGLCAEKPAQFLNIVNTLGNLNRSENDRRSLQMQVEKTAAELRLKEEQVGKLQEERQRAKAKIREQIEALGKALAAKSGGAGDRQRMMQAIVDTIDAM